MDEVSLETRLLTLPVHYWKRIEADPEVRDGTLTVEEWIRHLIYSQFNYSISYSEDLGDEDA